MINEEIVKNLLHPGDVIKNWKTLCQMFDEKDCIRSSNSGKAIQKRLRQFCDFEFEGQKIIIKSIKEKPVPIEDKRKSNSKYSQYIQAMLLQAVYDHGGTIYIKPTDLWKKCGMVNEKYKSNKTTALSLDVKQWELDSFYRLTGSTLNQLILTAVRTLRIPHLIYFEIQTVIVTVDGESFIANGEDYNKIEGAKAIALSKLECSSDKDVILKHKTKEYYKIIQRRLKKLYGWKYYYTQYKLSETVRSLTLEAIDKLDVQLKLNRNIVSCLNHKIDKMVDDQLKRYNDEKTHFKYPDYFMHNQKLLVNKLVNIDPNEIYVDMMAINYDSDYDLFG